MKSANATFRRLESDKIIETVKALHGRIEERFPGSGLGKVVAELLQVAEETVGRTRWIQQHDNPQAQHYRDAAQQQVWLLNPDRKSVV